MDSEVELSSEQYKLFAQLPRVARPDHPLEMALHACAGRHFANPKEIGRWLF